MSDMILNKVKKLLNLGNSTNEKEAQSAIEKAHQLLKDYNLSITDIQEDSIYDIIEEDIMESKTVSAWKWYIIVGVSKFNYCKLISTKYPNKVIQQFVGKQHNIVVAKEMVNYLFSVVERLAKNYGGDIRGDYKKGLAYRLCERLYELSKTEETQCTTLVIQEESMIDKYLKDNYSDLETKNRSTSIRSRLAFDCGTEDADDISLNTQIKSKSETVGGYL